MSVSYYTIWTQLFPPNGPLNQHNLPSQSGKVFIVTGGSNGLGEVLSRILYAAGGKVYILTRSEERAREAITRIQASCADGVGHGSLHFIRLDMMDFETVKSAAIEFLRREGPEGRLDVLFNNAGTGGRKNAPAGQQGFEYHMTTNTLGGFLLTRLLHPIISRTAEKSLPGSVRVVWPASLLVETGSPPSGIPQDFLDDQSCVQDYIQLYAQSKVGVWFLASEFARRETGRTVFIAGNPGTYNTNMWRYTPTLLRWLLRPILRDVARGADTYLWMAFSEDVTAEDAAAGRYAMCDGRWHPGQRDDLVVALRGEEEGGSGRAREFFEWCERAIKPFVS